MQKAELGQIAEIQMGYQVKGRIDPVPDGTHLLIQTGDVNGEGEIAWEKLAPFVPDRRGAERYKLMDGDVLFLAKGTRRVTTVVRNLRPGSMAVSTFFVLRVRDDAVILPEYLAWFLNVAARDEITAAELKGTTMTFVPSEALAALEITLPDTATQQKIAALYELMKREKQLTMRLLEERTRLVNALAKRVIAGEDA